MSEKPIRVLITDDHAVVRKGLSALIQTEPGMEVVGEAGDGEEAVFKARTVKPDVILMDLVMPRKDGISAITDIKRENPNARILVLTSIAEDQKIMAAIKAGALGYLLKDASPDELLRAIRSVSRGESSLHPAVAQRVLHSIQNPVQEPHDDGLTERENEILRLIAKGLPNQQIAKELSISERTVRTHVSNILRKLHLPNRTQAALYAIREGLVTPDKVEK
jgi:NarL family two-component system response regulator LiaR